MLLLRQGIVVLLLEKRRHRKRESGGIKSCPSKSTRGGSQLGVNIEHLLDERA
jgi:hypothetical protein